MLCFHGIGQNGLAYEPFGAALASTFTVYSFDLFYHGQSSGLHGNTYQPNEALTPDHWAAILTAFLDEKNIDRFSVTGFSMGGVFAFATAQRFAARLDQLWLLAPDGITTNAWYSFATGSGFGRGVFRFFLNHLSLLRGVSNTLVRLGLIDRSLVRFAQSTLATPEQRERVYRSWIAFRPLRPHLDSLLETLNEHPIRVRVFLGQFDRVLPREAVEPLLQRLPTCELVMLKVGHNGLVEAVAQSMPDQRR
ncbi:MAG: alpha/beta hydrolase [Rudanella sp.]|nr:alpha/beta hydrolase [Rudanella sp.]